MCARACLGGWVLGRCVRKDGAWIFHCVIHCVSFVGPGVRCPRVKSFFCERIGASEIFQCGRRHTLRRCSFRVAARCPFRRCSFRCHARRSMGDDSRACRDCSSTSASDPRVSQPQPLRAVSEGCASALPCQHAAQHHTATLLGGRGAWVQRTIGFLAMAGRERWRCRVQSPRTPIA